MLPPGRIWGVILALGNDRKEPIFSIGTILAASAADWLPQQSQRYRPGSEYSAEGDLLSCSSEHGNFMHG